ncbi:MAG: hypothetical protein HOP10_16945 [Chitinophagaceae bacterium]|nr:hypothetical protein [Chitinophagaceae bacterium]
MKKLFFIPVVIFLIACNNSKKDTQPSSENNNSNVQQPADNNTPSTTTAPANSTSVTYSVEGTEINNYASILVSKDKDNLQAGAPFICMLNSNSAKNNNEYLTLNFIFDTKPGTYPVVGYSFQRGNSPDNEMYGGLLGGKPKLTDYKVTITECKDLGSNNLGGHKWSISGTCEDISIKAAGIMLMDKSKNHPAEIKINKISFSNLSFDDNWEEMMEKAMDQMKKNK